MPMVCRARPNVQAMVVLDTALLSFRGPSSFSTPSTVSTRRRTRNGSTPAPGRAMKRGSACTRTAARSQPCWSPSADHSTVCTSGCTSGSTNRRDGPSGPTASCDKYWPSGGPPAPRRAPNLGPHLAAASFDQGQRGVGEEAHDPERDDHTNEGEGSLSDYNDGRLDGVRGPARPLPQAGRSRLGGWVT